MTFREDTEIKFPSPIFNILMIFFHWQLPNNVLVNLDYNTPQLKALQPIPHTHQSRQLTSIAQDRFHEDTEIKFPSPIFNIFLIFFHW